MTSSAVCVFEVHVTLSCMKHGSPVVSQYHVKLRYRARPTVNGGWTLCREGHTLLDSRLTVPMAGAFRQ